MFKIGEDKYRVKVKSFNETIHNMITSSLPELQIKIREKRLLGEFELNNMIPEVSLVRVSHIIESIDLVDNDTYWCNIRICKTDAGKEVKLVLDQVPYGVRLVPRLTSKVITFDIQSFPISIQENREIMLNDLLD